MNVDFIAQIIPKIAFSLWRLKPTNFFTIIHENHICVIKHSEELEYQLGIDMHRTSTLKSVQNCERTELQVLKTSIQVENETQGERLTILPYKSRWKLEGIGLLGCFSL